MEYLEIFELEILQIFHKI